MNLILLSKLLLILFSAVGTFTAIMGFMSERTRKSFIFKVMLVLCSLVILMYVSLQSYLEIINRDQIFADLTIRIGEPYLVNYDGTETDRYVVDADYNVVSFNQAFSIETKIEMENVYTHEKFTYNTSLMNSGYTIANVGSGVYDLTITTREYDVYKQRISLNTTNLYNDEDKPCWDFTAFMFDDFNENAVEFKINIGDVRENVQYPVFGIESENITVYGLFSSDVDWDNNGLLAGTFVGYRDVYTVHNCITTSTMEAVIIDVSGQDTE